MNIYVFRFDFALLSIAVELRSCSSSETCETKTRLLVLAQAPPTEGWNTAVQNCSIKS